jgi:non-homologous end joining protein Ku
VSPRPYWKGYLKLSLVSCPIALLVSPDQPQDRLRQQLIDEESLEPVYGHESLGFPGPL